MILSETVLQRSLLEDGHLHTLDLVPPDLLCCPNLIHQEDIIKLLASMLSLLSTPPTKTIVR